jgi:hypothetical protein
MTEHVAVDQEGKGSLPGAGKGHSLLLGHHSLLASLIAVHKGEQFCSDFAQSAQVQYFFRQTGGTP